MKINNTGKSYEIEKLYLENSKKIEKKEVEKQGKQGDRLELSSESKGIKKYVSIMKDVPINFERVERIKTEIKNGEYQISTREIADKMVQKMKEQIR